jgi:hypothetical protein
MVKLHKCTEWPGSILVAKVNCFLFYQVKVYIPNRDVDHTVEILTLSRND